MSPEWTNQAGEMSSPFRGHWLDTMGLCQSAHLLRYLSLPVLFAGVTCVERAEWHGRALKAPLFCSDFTVGLLRTGLCDDLVLSISPRMWHEQTILWSHPHPLPPGCWSCSPKGPWCTPSSQSLVSTVFSPSLIQNFFLPFYHATTSAAPVCLLISFPNVKSALHLFARRLLWLGRVGESPS